ALAHENWNRVMAKRLRKEKDSIEAESVNIEKKLDTIVAELESKTFAFTQRYQYKQLDILFGKSALLDESYAKLQESYQQTEAPSPIESSTPSVEENDTAPEKNNQ
ncbi:MAG: hypothetical protein K8S56_02330, partial [Candidatus Cloacimonetes bacterium]|nr:hypothetical protein [Candidatus Cloacimonadota bacterium]